MITCKWPGLLVLGDPIPEDLALEINLRTWSWSSNERHYMAEIASRILGRPVDRWEGFYQNERAAKERIRALRTYYLSNAWITSNWVGGPKGWCRPDGQIRTCNYNIGKWPSAEDVEEGLAEVAAEWPVLRMRVQVLSGETYEPDLHVTDEWEVEGGRVRAVTPGTPVLQPEEAPWSLGGSEIGIEPRKVFATIDRLLAR